MTKSLIAAAALIASIHQAAFAEQRLFHMNTSGVTTNALSTTGQYYEFPYTFTSDTWIDPNSVEVSYSPSGSRTEKVFGLSSYLLDVGWTVWAPPGYATTITAITEDASATSKRYVDLSFKTSFEMDGTSFRLDDYNYRFAVTGEWSLSTLLSSSSGFSFGPSAEATLTHVEYDYLQNPSNPPLEMRALHGSFVSSVPEPGTYAMLGVGLGLIGLSRRNRQAKCATPALV